MAQERPDELLGIEVDDPSERRDDGEGNDESEAVERFVFLEIGDRRLAVPVDDVKTIVEPTDLTRVPRSPDPIEGVMDLRGEITAVIDPRIHFPTERETEGQGRLVVFDRPTDRQAAAVRVDEVVGVETVPASDVVTDDADLEGLDVADGTLAHPLVVGVVRQRRRPDAGVREVVGGTRTARDGDPSGSGPGNRESIEALEPDDGAARTPGEALEERLGPIATTNDEPGDGRGGASPATRANGPADEDRRTGGNGRTVDGSTDEAETVVETTALLSVDHLLLASGRAD